MRLNFDASTVAPGGNSSDLLPPGEYDVKIVATEEVTTSSGNGTFLKIDMVVTAPADFAGSALIDRLNLNNPNPKAVEIATKTLSQICHAAGKLQIAESAELHDCVVRAVTDQEDRGQYGLQTRLRRYRPASGTPQGPMGGQPTPQPNGGAPAAAAAAAAPQAAAPQATKMPWERG